MQRSTCVFLAGQYFLDELEALGQSCEIPDAALLFAQIEQALNKARLVIRSRSNGDLSMSFGILAQLLSHEDPEVVAGQGGSPRLARALRKRRVADCLAELKILESHVRGHFRQRTESYIRAAEWPLWARTSARRVMATIYLGMLWGYVREYQLGFRVNVLPTLQRIANLMVPGSAVMSTSEVSEASTATQTTDR